MKCYIVHPRASCPSSPALSGPKGRMETSSNVRNCNRSSSTSTRDRSERKRKSKVGINSTKIAPHSLGEQPNEQETIARERKKRREEKEKVHDHRKCGSADAIPTAPRNAGTGSPLGPNAILIGIGIGGAAATAAGGSVTIGMRAFGLV